MTSLLFIFVISSKIDECGYLCLLCGPWYNRSAINYHIHYSAILLVTRWQYEKHATLRNFCRWRCWKFSEPYIRSYLVDWPWMSYRCFFYPECPANQPWVKCRYCRLRESQVADSRLLIAVICRQKGVLSISDNAWRGVAYSISCGFMMLGTVFWISEHRSLLWEKLIILVHWKIVLIFSCLKLH